MNTNQTCENYQKCPVFLEKLQGKEITAKGYKRKYCNAGPAGWEACKRYQVKNLTGTCPPHVLPNALRSVEEIVSSINRNPN